VQASAVMKIIRTKTNGLICLVGRCEGDFNGSYFYCTIKIDLKIKANSHVAPLMYSPSSFNGETNFQSPFPVWDHLGVLGLSLHRPCY
jgi:hypothetical protein